MSHFKTVYETFSIAYKVPIIGCPNLILIATNFQLHQLLQLLSLLLRILETFSNGVWSRRKRITTRMSETNKFVCYHSKYESSWMHVRPTDESERSDEWTNQKLPELCAWRHCDWKNLVMDNHNLYKHLESRTIYQNKLELLTFDNLMTSFVRGYFWSFYLTSAN